MAAPKIDQQVLDHPDVQAARKVAEAAVRDYLHTIADVAVDVHVTGEPAPRFTRAWSEQVWEYAAPLDRTDQDIYLLLGPDELEWAEHHQHDTQRRAAA